MLQAFITPYQGRKNTLCTNGEVINTSVALFLHALHDEQSNPASIAHLDLTLSIGENSKRGNDLIHLTTE